MSNTQFVIGLCAGVGIANLLTSHFLHKAPWGHSILFGASAAVICFALSWLFGLWK
jgi:hypothetical protein